jgi:hypothetical protein
MVKELISSRPETCNLESFRKATARVRRTSVDPKLKGPQNERTQMPTDVKKFHDEMVSGLKSMGDHQASGAQENCVIIGCSGEITFQNNDC